MRIGSERHDHIRKINHRLGQIRVRIQADRQRQRRPNNRANTAKQLPYRVGKAIDHRRAMKIDMRY